MECKYCKQKGFDRCHFVKRGMKAGRKVRRYYCHCGCGIRIKPGKKFVHGHNGRGKQHTLEAKARIAEAKRGKLRPCIQGERHYLYGKHPSEESRAKMSESHRGKSCPHLRGAASPMRREEVKAKISGENHYMKRPEYKGRFSGKDGHFWLGGIAKDPYGPGDTEALKERIRVRDAHICQECSRVWAEGEKRFVAHHIDYDKENHTWWNRITLCNSYHAKTITNRQYWIVRFNNLLLERFDEALFLL